MRFLRPRAALWLLTALLAACASQPPTSDSEQDWSAHRAQLELTDHWTLQGKLALSTTDRSESATVVWSQSGDKTNLRLTGPLGAGATQVTSDGKTMQVSSDGRSQRFDVSSPAAIAANTGFNLPIKALPFWVRGLPAPQPPETGLVLDQGRLLSFSQAGWQINYTAYGNADGLPLPTRITLEKADTRARLVIRRWQLETDQ